VDEREPLLGGQLLRLAADSSNRLPTRPKRTWERFLIHSKQETVTPLALR
jgi:hypothetical protein